MKFAFTVERGTDINLVRACSTHEILVRERRIGCSVILSTGEIIEHWPPRAAQALTAEHLAPALALKPQVLLIGTGARQHFPQAEVLAPVYRAGVGVEIMDTAAACRTYNVLVQEGRHVVAALIIEAGDAEHEVGGH